MLHEIKNDDFRIMAQRDGSSARLNHLQRYVFTSRFPLATTAVTVLLACTFLIDGRSHLHR
jgi:hypothetical protein